MKTCNHQVQYVDADGVIKCSHCQETIQPYHTHSRDEQLANDVKKEAGITAIILLAVFAVGLVFGCWLGHRAGYNAAMVEVYNKSK